MVAGLLLVVVLGVLLLRVVRWRADVRLLREYSSEPTISCSGPTWIIDLIGRTPFQCAVTELRGRDEAGRLGDSQMTDFVELLERFPSLVRLDLDGSKIGDDGVAKLARLTQLRQLSLGGTRVTDKGLGHLQTLTQLRQLSLEATDVTDAGMPVVAGLPSLESINLERTQVTDAGTQLLVVRPGLQIDFTDD